MVAPPLVPYELYILVCRPPVPMNGVGASTLRFDVAFTTGENPTYFQVLVWASGIWRLAGYVSPEYCNSLILIFKFSGPDSSSLGVFLEAELFRLQSLEEIATLGRRRAAGRIRDALTNGGYNMAVLALRTIIPPAAFHHIRRELNEAVEEAQRRYPPGRSGYVRRESAYCVEPDASVPYYEFSDWESD